MEIFNVIQQAKFTLKSAVEAVHTYSILTKDEVNAIIESWIITHLKNDLLVNVI